MTHWDIPWAIWAATTLITFGVIETAALLHHHPDRTLSERLRAWLGIAPHRPWRGAGIAAFLAFFVWFVPHILAGWGA